MRRCEAVKCASSSSRSAIERDDAWASRSSVGAATSTESAGARVEANSSGRAASSAGREDATVVEGQPQPQMNASERRWRLVRGLR